MNTDAPSPLLKHLFDVFCPIHKHKHKPESPTGRAGWGAMTRPLTTLDLSLTTSRWSAAWDPTITPPTYPSTLPRSSPNGSSPQQRGTHLAVAATSCTKNAKAGPSRIPLGDITPMERQRPSGSGPDYASDSASSVGAFTQDQQREEEREPEQLGLEVLEDLEELAEEKHEEIEITGIEDITDTQWAEAEEDRRKRKSSQASGSSGSGNHRDRVGTSRASRASRASRGTRASSRGWESDVGSSPPVRSAARRFQGSRADISSSVAVDCDEDMASPSLPGTGTSAGAQSRTGCASASDDIRPSSLAPQTPQHSERVFEADWIPSLISPRTRARRDGHGAPKSKPLSSPDPKDGKTPGLEDLFNSPPARKRRQRQAFVLSSDEEDEEHAGGGGGAISTVSRCGRNDRTNDDDQDGRKGKDKGKRRALTSNVDNPASSSGGTKRNDILVLSSSRKTTRKDDVDNVDNDNGEGDVAVQDVPDEDEYDLPLGDLVDLDIDLDPSRSVTALGSDLVHRSGPSRPLSNLGAKPTSIPTSSVVHSSVLDALDLNLRTAPITSRIHGPASYLPTPARASTTHPGLNAAIGIVSPTSLRLRLDQPVMFISDMAERDQEFYLNHWRRGADKGEGEAGKQAGWDLVEEDEEDEEEAGERGWKGRVRGATMAGSGRRGRGAAKRGGTGRSRGGAAKYFRGRGRGGWRGKAGAKRK